MKCIVMLTREDSDADLPIQRTPSTGPLRLCCCLGIWLLGTLHTCQQDSTIASLACGDMFVACALLQKIALVMIGQPPAVWATPSTETV